MKTIGLIGGMSWESSALYYQILNIAVRKQLGGLHSAKCILYSVDFQEIEACQSGGDWAKSGQMLSEAARNLERAGADFIVICTNTMHKVAGQVQTAITIPILHIADLTAEALVQNGIRKVGLLGTKYTMEQDFYKARLIEKGIDVLTPEPEDRVRINDIIYQELCLGVLREASKDAYLHVIRKMAAEGAQGVILGCTEIGLLIKAGDAPVPLFDTTIIHAERAVEYALQA